MARVRSILIISLALLATACAATPPLTQDRAAAAPSGGPALLLLDGASVAMTFRTGPGSTVRGERGPGLFTNTYRASTNTFGPAPITSHTPDALTFQTRSTTCTLRAGGTVTCADGTQGIWNAV